MGCVATAQPAAPESITPQPLRLTSPVVANGGALPREYTCDGASASLPLAWSGLPQNTKSLAIIMHHVAAPDDVHWYWVAYNISPSINHVDKNDAGGGILGSNSVNRKTEYAPPCSKGPGEKVYTYTLYALSATPELRAPPAQVTRDVLLDAIKNSTLDSATLKVTYSR